MGIGVVSRNHLGLVLAANRGFIHHVDDPELGEAIPRHHALIFAEDSGFQKILVETDCASLISKIKSKVDDRSYTGAVVFDIKSRAPRFLSCCFTHVSRRCNEAAHVLAKSAEHDEGSCWFNVSPEVIRNIVCTE
uniref:RNase H type-1 domain-containing protein n=1 Tax=Aegilops tauschii subsp. strangulata TaxID=200361 RepID=A0A453GST1_AEGTS